MRRAIWRAIVVTETYLEREAVPSLEGMAPADWQRYVRNLDLPPTTKLVAYALSTYADLVAKGGGKAGENAYPSQTRLAVECGLTPRTVRRHLAELRGLFLLERTRSGSSLGVANTSDGYRLVVPRDGPERLPWLSTSTGRR